MSKTRVVVTGAFDDARSREIRFFEEAARLGKLTILLWPDDAVMQFTGRPPKFPLVERLYFLNAIRYVARIIPVGGAMNSHELPAVPSVQPDLWADLESSDGPARAKFCRERNLVYRVFTADELKGFPGPLPTPSVPGRKKVVVTGSYDWFHSGHVRFFEEVSTYGDVYAVIGHDANIRLLKGEGHPLLPQAERRYVVGSIKFVKQALISSGDGWLDADPEIREIKPDFYVVNKDGDKGGKREYCRKLGIEYLVLERQPAPGLPKRSSTDLRGF